MAVAELRGLTNSLEGPHPSTSKADGGCLVVGGEATLSAATQIWPLSHVEVCQKEH